MYIPDDIYIDTFARRDDIYMYIHTYTHTHIHTYIHTYMHTYIPKGVRGHTVGKQLDETAAKSLRGDFSQGLGGEEGAGKGADRANRQVVSG